jgi:hypothetical protein
MKGSLARRQRVGNASLLNAMVDGFGTVLAASNHDAARAWTSAIRNESRVATIECF